MPYLSGGNNLLDPQAIFKRLGLNTGATVADLGCGGAGHFIIPAARLAGKNTTVYAVDILKTALQTVASKARLEGINNIKTVWSNLESVGATNIAAGSLDFAFLINILFQAKQPDKMIAEAARLLKDGGKLLVIDWNSTKVSFGPPANVRVAESNVKQLVQKLKLQLVESFSAGAYHYGLIFEK